jgi:hypothetical protein
VSARAHRAKKADPALDVHGRRVVCGVCRKAIGWDRASKQPVLAIPSGLTDAGSPGVYRWSTRASDKLQEGVAPILQHRNRAPGYTAEQWAAIGPVRFARLPCVIPCPAGHANEVTTAVLDDGTAPL